MLKCPVLQAQRNLEATGFWFRGINAGETDENLAPVPRSRPALLSEAAEVEVRLLEAHAEALQSTLLHSGAKGLFDANATLGTNARKRERHRLQRAAIVDAVSALDVVGRGHVFLEIGAGNGELSLAVAEAHPEAVRSDAFILLDRESKPRGKSAHGRLSADVQLEARCASVARVKVGIEDVQLSALRDSLAPGRPIVVLAKHLCGAASDYALRAIAASSSDVRGVVLSTCCHHRCTWSSYPSREYLRSLRCADSRSAFDMLCRLSSRGVNAHDFSARADAGRRAKDLIDEGRAAFLRERGYDASLARFVDASVTPENVLIVGSLSECTLTPKS